MKKIFFLIAVSLLITLAGYSQKLSPTQVPAPVKIAFATDYGHATYIEFWKENTVYEIKYIEKDINKSITYDPNGKVMQTETEIKQADLPKEVSAAVTKAYPGYKTAEIIKVEKTGNPMFYELYLKSDNGSKNKVHLSSKGDILSKEPYTKVKTWSKKD
jgi:uncharacterized membrane protein YkoI